MSEIDRIRHQQHARLRRRILTLLDSAKPAGGLRGRMIMDLLISADEAPEDDDALCSLLTDLVHAQLAVETDLRRYHGQRRGLDQLHYAITARGTALLEERIDPDPLVADPRMNLRRSEP